MSAGTPGEPINSSAGMSGYDGSACCAVVGINRPGPCLAD